MVWRLGSGVWDFRVSGWGVRVMGSDFWVEVWRVLHVLGVLEEACKVAALRRAPFARYRVQRLGLKVLGSGVES